MTVGATIFIPHVHLYFFLHFYFFGKILIIFQFLTIPGANITATNGTELCNALSGGMLVGSNVTVVVNSTGCFAGPDANEIGQLTCNPWVYFHSPSILRQNKIIYDFNQCSQ